MDYVYHILILVIMYAILVQSLNLIMGYVGVISMGHAVFSGIGAYSAALISIHLGYNFLVGMAVGFVLSAIVGALLALPSLRVRDEYLIVFTVGFQMVVFEFMLTARGITQGQGGIPGIPPAEIWGMSFHTPLRFLPLLAVVGVICFAVAWRVIHSPFGRVLKAIREDESASRALGKNTLSFKVLVFALSGGLAAVTGSLMAHYISFISPFSFTIEVSVFIIVMVVLGGEANFWGPIMGAAILMGITEALRFVPGASSYIDAAREIFYGFILMFLMIFRPQGILPEHSKRFKKSLHSRRGSFPRRRCGGAGSGQGARGSFGRRKSRTHPGDPGPFQILWGSASRGRRFAEIVSARHNRSDRPQRLREDHALQYGERISGARSGGGLCPRRGGDGSCALQAGHQGSGPFLAGCAGVQGNDRSGQRHGCPAAIRPVKIYSCSSSARDEWPGRSAKICRAALEYLQLVGLLDKAGQLAGSLSNAEQKLVAIARLLATECPILFLDEPTAALDIDSVERVIQLIQEIAVRKDKTILLVEHNLDVVRGLVKKAYFMSEGKILAEGEPAKLMADPKLAEVYFGID